MADEAFEALWAMPSGPELVALHGMFGGATMTLPDLRTLLGLSSDQARDLVQTARRVGLVESAGESVSFLAFAPGSAQQGRLEWCLEPHQAEHDAAAARLRTALTLRWLAAPPGSPA